MRSFAEQCCDGGSFDRGFRRLMQEIFPSADAQLQLLPPQHPVWRMERKIDPRHLRELWGIDVGCRTGVIYCPQDLACYWELARLGRETKYSQQVQEQIEAARGVGLNVLAYATNRELKFKDPASHLAGGSIAADTARGGFCAANVVHPGGCYSAPAALANLLQLFSLKYGVQGDYRPGEVRLSDAELFNYHLVFLHGREQFQLTPAEQDNLREYVERGGMMFADAICSSREFASSFRAEMEVIFPENPLVRIPPGDPFFTACFGGEEIVSVSRRELVKKADGEPADTVVHREEPFLEGLKVDDYYAVVFSPYDVSCALTGRETLGCDGYARADAVKIAVNMLFYTCH